MASNRHLARIVAMQSLYEWDFRKTKLKSQKSKNPKEEIKKIMERNISEFASSINNVNFIHDLVNGVLENESRIDKVIAPAAPEWPVEQIAMVDKIILRLSIYELLFIREVPPKVIINEAVELAKAFGGGNSSKFVNGVLGTVYRSSDLYDEEEEKKEKDSLKKKDK